MNTRQAAKQLSPIQPTVRQEKRKPGRPPRSAQQQRDRSPTPKPVPRLKSVVDHPTSESDTDMQSLLKEFRELKEKVVRLESSGAGVPTTNRSGSVIPLPADDVRNVLLHQGNLRNHISGASDVFKRLASKPPVHPNYPIPERHAAYLPAVPDRVKAALADAS